MSAMPSVPPCWQGQQAVARLVDLYALRETLLEQLKVLLKQSASLGSA
jgi:hypothetical protein